MQTIEVVDEEAVAALIDWPMAIEAVRSAFIAQWRAPETYAPPLAAQGGAPHTAINIKYAALDGLVGLKAGTYWSANRARGLASHGATTLLLDPDTGFARAFVSATLLNRYRTAAANAVAAEALARKDARTLALVGAGGQAEYEARALCAVRSIERITIGVREPARALRLQQALGDLDADVFIGESSAAARDADIVVTVTNAREPILRAGDLRAGAHCAAMGADGRGKQELDVALVRSARLFADWPAQAMAVGELQHAIAAHAIAATDITAIGAVLAGAAQGRLSQDEITLFDSSGLGAQDIYVADAILRAARARGLVRTVSF